MHGRPEPGVVFGPAPRPPFLRRHRRRLVALLFWLLLLGGYQLFAWRQGLTPREAAEQVIHIMTFGAAGALIYVSFYALSRLVFFPPTLLSMAAGFVFGPIWGVALAVLGANTAAVVSYLMGRYFGRGLIGPERTSGTLERFAGRMRENGFESVLLLRLVFAPFDPVSILAGSLGIDWRRYVLATLLGSLPAILSLVLFGAALETNFTASSFRLNPWTLLASVALFVASLLLSRYLRPRKLEGKGGA